MTNYAHPEALIDTQCLADHLNDVNLRIVEVDISPEIYQNAHIPGAVFWNLFTDLLQPNLCQNLNATAIEKLLAQSGITNEMTVVAYGSNPGTGAWIFWLLKLFGHQNVRVLNGGYQKWLAQNRPVAANLSTYAPTQYLTKPLDANLRVLHEEVLASMNHPEQVLLDVRTIQEYRGEYFYIKPPEGTEKAGHIPGSVHLENLLIFNEDGTFKSFEQLQALYLSKGITSEQEIFPYCTIGARSAGIWFVLKYLLGYANVRNYDGSWNEWSRLPNVPIEQ